MRSDTGGPGAVAGAPLVWLSAMAAVLGSAIICVFAQDLVPPGHGPEYAIFLYNGELVAIGLTGGIVPLLASLAMLAAAWTGPRSEVHRPAPFRSHAYWSAVLLVGVVITLFFTASHALYGGLGLSKLWAFWLVLAGGVAGVDYWWLRGRRLGVTGGAAECYVMGTLGAFAGDVIRTLTGLASAPGEAAVWGGGGLLDILFWFGLYVSVSFLSLRVILAVLTRARVAVLHSRASAR
jgi:hypothetical protein